jgi:hypothetical protein
MTNGNTLVMDGEPKKSLGRMAESFCSTATTASSTRTSALHCVAFDLEPQVYNVPALCELSLEERQSTWYSPHEKNDMIEQAMALAYNESCLQPRFFAYYSSSRSEAVEEQEETTSRGLEFYSVEGSRRRKLNRIKVMIAVLKEQQRQQEQETSAEQRDELIQAASVAVSRSCQDEAYSKACQDEEAVLPQKPRCTTTTTTTTRVDAPKRKGVFSCFTQLVKDISDIGYVEWAAQ